MMVKVGGGGADWAVGEGQQQRALRAEGGNRKISGGLPGPIRGPGVLSRQRQPPASHGPHATQSAEFQPAEPPCLSGKPMSGSS